MALTPEQTAAYLAATTINNPLWNYYNTYQTINGARHYLLPFPVSSLSGAIGSNAAAPVSNTPAPPPPQFQFTFDTIGQVIFRSIGNCRLPIRTIWAQGVVASGATSTSNTQTFAGAVCAPIDPDEQGFIFEIWDGGNLIFNSSGVVIPPSWSPANAALLATSLANIVVYPGDESQLPAPLIVADKGANVTNAFRGIRYIIFPDYPIGGSGGNGIPQISVAFSPGVAPPTSSFTAVEFYDGAT